MEKLSMIDLCSGLGGASQPFLDREWNVLRIDNDPKFKNIQNTFIGNIKNIEKIIYTNNICDKGKIKPDFVWASPPCNCFSVASIHLNWTKRRKPKHKRVVDSIRTVVWCLDAIEFLKPKFWALENPRAKLRNILNKPGVIYPGLTTDLGLWGAKSPKPTDIWGYFPKITLPLFIAAGNNSSKITLPNNDPEKNNNLAVSINGNEKNYLESNNGKVNYQASMYGNAKKRWNNQSSRKEMRALIPYNLGETIAIAIEKELDKKR